jgi:hypothetical protein
MAAVNKSRTYGQNQQKIQLKNPEVELLPNFVEIIHL